MLNPNKKPGCCREEGYEHFGVAFMCYEKVCGDQEVFCYS